MKRLIMLLLISTAFASCKNLVPYTDSMKKQYNWSDDQVQRIQFYVSHDIVLHRELTNGSTEIVLGKIKTVRGKKVEEIIIRGGTPGVLTSIPREGKMMVSFEMSDDHNLSFGINPNQGQRYVLLASDWNNGRGTVHYSGQEYVADADSKFAYLMVDLRKINKLQLSQRVAKGRKVQ